MSQRTLHLVHQAFETKAKHIVSFLYDGDETNENLCEKIYELTQNIHEDPWLVEIKEQNYFRDVVLTDVIKNVGGWRSTSMNDTITILDKKSMKIYLCKSIGWHMIHETNLED